MFVEARPKRIQHNATFVSAFFVVGAVGCVYSKIFLDHTMSIGRLGRTWATRGRDQVAVSTGCEFYTVVAARKAYTTAHYRRRDISERRRHDQGLR